MKKVCIIPARLASSRLKHKVLETIEGKSLVERSFLKALKSEFFDEVVVAVDDERVARHLKEKSIPFFMTDKACESGTERLIELYKKGEIKGDFYINWQADEPFLPLEMLVDFFNKVEKSKADIVTVARKIDDEKRATSSHVVKVVKDFQGRALYFSRACIPFYRETTPFKDKTLFEHIGLYGYFAKALEKMSSMPPSFLEKAEQLEQLKFLEYGLTIDVAMTRFESIGVDTLEGLMRAREHFKKSERLFL